MTVLITKIINLRTKKTSMRLAKAEWEAVEMICKQENVKRNFLINAIADNKDPQMALTSSVRLFVTSYLYYLYQDKITPHYSSIKKAEESPIFRAIKSII